ncbi:MAG: leucyl/phenylalanyl-tRNA--protein transferase, partial [Actinomycetota bacterium]
IGGLFAGESMFHTRTDASKVALVALMALLVSAGVTLFDVQWVTPHLASLGAIEVSRDEYLRLLDDTRNGPSSRQTADHD